MRGVIARGGGVSGAVSFVWEVLRFQLAATFPPQNSVFCDSGTRG